MSKIIGIDLGTTFSAIGFVRDGVSEILPNGAQRIVPSVVGFNTNGQLLVGTPALNQYVLYPENTVRSIKRLMGTDATVRLNGRDYSPAEVSAIILREMKRIAEASLGESVDRVVITVPAYFSDAARQATREAGEIAGFTVERIINEPTAAALAYGLNSAADRELVAVYDLGGGTFDVSIVELNEGVLEVRASHGDTHLGGDDFDAMMLDFLAETCKKQFEIDPREDPKTRARLLRAAEAAKIALSSEPFVRIREAFLFERDGIPLHLDVEIDRSEFEAMISERLDATITAFDQALADAGITASQLDRVLLVGGSTRIPLVWKRVAEHTGLEPIVAINPDEAVALGAGVQAAIIAGEPIDTILVDLTPHSLGIEVAERAFGMIVPDRYGIIIHRNSALPISRTEGFSAMHPGQTTILVKVYQGEEPIASRNTLLGEFNFEGLKPYEPGEPPKITVKFDLDINGILNVSAVDRGSNAVRQTTLQAAHSRLSANAKEASARYIAELESADLDLDLSDLEDLQEIEDIEDFEEVDDPDFEENDAIVAEALRQLDESGKELPKLSELVVQIRAARRQDDKAEVERLREAIAEYLYELEEE